MSRHPSQRILSVWLPDWPVQRLRSASPDLVGEPIVVSLSTAQTEVVEACSLEARRLGVCVGMKTPDAQALVSSRRLRVFPSTPGEDRKALERLAADCLRFSPTVALEDTEQPSALLLDVTGLARLWGKTESTGEEGLAGEVSRWLRDQKLQGSIVVADTVGLSLSAAKYSQPSPGDGSPPLVIQPAASYSIVQALPIEALRADAATTEALQQLGFGDIGQLLQLPRSGLLSRFGDGLIVRIDQLLGVIAEPLIPHQAETPLRVVWPFENAVANAEVLDRTIKKLLERLAVEMRRRRCGALRVLIRYLLDTSRQSLLVEQVVLRLFRPTNSAKELAELAELRSDKLRFRHAVREIQIVVGSSVAIRPRQQTLFDGEQRGDEHELAMLVNRLAGRIGDERVSRLEKRRSVDPDRSYALLPATETAAKRFSLTDLQAETARRAPLAKYRRADPIEVETDTHGVPIAVRLPARCTVARVWGPERIETGWWRGRGPRRDAYWVELQDGSRLWLCFDLRSRGWTLAGEFL